MRSGLYFLLRFLMLKKVMIVGLVCSTLLCCKADRITVLRVEGGSRPTFLFSGGGWLINFRVQNTGSKNQAAKNADVVWEIEAENANDGAKHISQITPLQYGIVPAGYRQILPATGKAPSLLEGQVYLTMAYTSGSSFGRAVFTLQNGKVVTEETMGGH
jgi:hypothetical protein